MELITGSKDLQTAIKRLATSAKKLNATVHLCAVSCLAHVRDSGDWTQAAALLDALPSGQRVKALAFWFKHFSSGKLSFSVRDDGLYKGRLAKDRGPSDFRVTEAEETTFGDLTSEKAPTILTAAAMVKMLTNRASRNEINEDGERVATRAALLLAGQLEKVADELVKSPEFAAAMSEEKSIMAEKKAA